MRALSFLHSSSSTSFPNLLPIFRTTLLKPSSQFTHLHRPTISFHHHPLSSPPSANPQTPLFLKPPTHTSSLTDLNSFANWAKTLISQVGSSFQDVDNGPDSTLLLRELKWFLEDTIEDPSMVHQLGVGEFPGGKGEIRARVSLEEMYRLWKQRVEERRPFQYVVGCEHWRDLVLCVEDGVLIPRPETEMIVDLVDDAVRENGGLRGGLWADLGTGSGALAIGIGRILGEGGRVIAVDLCPKVVSTARFNVERYGLQDIVEIRQGSWFDPLVDVQGQLAGFVSNPPYIPSHNIVGLQAEVAKHEPKLALDGGADGMDSLLSICRRAAMMLKPGGFFVLEVELQYSLRSLVSISRVGVSLATTSLPRRTGTNGEEHCNMLKNYMENETGDGFRSVKVTSDFAGIPRFVSGFRT